MNEEQLREKLIKKLIRIILGARHGDWNLVVRYARSVADDLEGTPSDAWADIIRNAVADEEPRYAVQDFAVNP